jgi:asparagine synthase (glutamine-hydrolysing)
MREKGGFRFHEIGNGPPPAALEAALLAGEADGHAALAKLLRGHIGHYAAIIESGNAIVAYVDAVRSYPVFYAEGGGSTVSNAARLAKDTGGCGEWNDAGLLEMAMTGYVTGRETAFRRLFQLQAGELLVWERGEPSPRLHRYYRYLPEERPTDESQAMDRLFGIADRMFGRVIEAAQGKAIWVPLSGGLDSRLVICKLKELGYDNLRTFSYGPRGNYEASAAKQVADTLGVPWEFVPTPARLARRAFRSPERRRYQDFADGLCSVPVFNDYYVLGRLKEQGRLSEGDLIVNGQTGDFLTGGHIPGILLQPDPSVRSLLDALVKKHYSVWRHLGTPENMAIMETRILDGLRCSLADKPGPEELAARYESWEWQERQCKYVVNGQRVYDFLGLGWALPMWDLEFMDFWATVPMRLRFGQEFFRRYLGKWDYKGLFRGYRSEARRWPGPAGLAVKAVDKVLTISSLNRLQRRFVRDASYFGHYGNLYRMHGFGRFLSIIPRATVPPQARGVVALNLETWFRDNQAARLI